MKMKTKRRAFSLFLAIFTLIAALPAVPFATLFASAAATTIDPATVPEAVSYESVLEAGLIERMYDEEHDLKTVVFRGLDNVNTAYLFDEDVKYVDESGKTKDKSNALTRQSNGTYRNLKNDIAVTYPRVISDGVSIAYGGWSMRVSPITEGETVLISAVSHDAAAPNVVSYPDAFGEGTILRYTQTFSGYKEDLILEQAPAVNVFSFLVSTNGAQLLNEQGKLAVKKDGEVLAEIGQVLVYDADGAQTVGSATVTTLAADRAYCLTLTVPQAFLDEASYPVTVDPPIRVKYGDGTNGSFSDGTMYSAYSGASGTESSLFVGDYDKWAGNTSETRGTARALVNVSPLYASINFMTLYHANKILNVYLAFYVVQGSEASVNMVANRVTIPWTEGSLPGSSSWWGSIAEEVGSVTIKTNGYQEYLININALVDYEISNPTTRYGLALSLADNTKRAVRINSCESNLFSSTGGPYIQYSYYVEAAQVAAIEAERIYRLKVPGTGRWLTRSDSDNDNLVDYSVASDGTVTRDVMQVSAATPSADQFLLFHHMGNGIYEIEPYNPVITNNTQYGLQGDMTEYRLTVNGTGVEIRPRVAGSSNQRWTIIPVASGQITYYRLYSTVTTAADATYVLTRPTTSSVNVNLITTTNADWELEFVGLNVPLRRQETPDTCSAAAGLMSVLFNDPSNTMTETQFFTAALTRDPSVTDTPLLGEIQSQLNVMFPTVGFTHSAIHRPGRNPEVISVTEVISRITISIRDCDQPVLALAKILEYTSPSATDHDKAFQYTDTTNGHYFVITGYCTDASGTVWFSILDPHYAHCKHLMVKAESVYEVIDAHRGTNSLGGYFIHDDTP